MWQQRISAGVVALIVLLCSSVLFRWMLEAREDARCTMSKNNLKQMGLALHNYADVYGERFPAGGVFDQDRHGRCGWMFTILPYVDAAPFLWNHFLDANQPWDSTQNAGVFLHDFPMLQNPGEPKLEGLWQFPVAHYCGNANILAANQFVKLDSIEGTSNVFIVGELDGGFVPWGCPYNWRELDRLNSTPPTFGRSTRDGCQILYADGRVSFLSNDVSKDILHQLKGEDLSGFHANELNIQIPTSFPCPRDAIKIDWSYRGDDLIVERRDIHGHVNTTVERLGK